MTRLTIMRNDQPASDQQREAAKAYILGALDGFTEDDKRGWRKFWRRALGMEPGELLNVDVVFPRSGPYHRRHMAIEQAVFNAQERFRVFDQFRYWTKVGAGWVTWAAGPKGGVVPIPKSISYSSADQEEFRQYHEAVMDFLRGEHAARYLWPHLRDEAGAMMDSVLGEFDE